ncbi:hypothetical protein GQ44DRAFT_606922 [Phaeosphaeriaceae sp. PMI808]|nr:hypothetical protein GQ44DRAFT_606922 [Phaeosphaeriaceae sp. PMI808]
MSAFNLKKSALVEEARQKTGHSPEQWTRFYLFTKSEVDAILKDHKDWTWRDVPSNVLQSMLDRVNGKLEEEDAPKVKMDVLTWRLYRAMKDRPGKLCHASLLP